MTQAIEDSKVYYPEDIEDVELTEAVTYNQVVGAPQSVSELNPVDGEKLGAIDYNDGDPAWINDIINARIDTAQKNILADWNFGDTDFAGGVYAGDISWSTATGAVTGGSGVLINRNGIIGAKNGNTTFAIDATTGDATFSGDVTASTITGGTITGATITGGTIRTSSGSTRIEMNGSNNRFESYVSGTIRMRLASGALNFYQPDGTYAGYIEASASALTLSSSISGGATLILGNGEISPFANGTKLGSSTFRWGNIYSQGNLNIQNIYGNDVVIEDLTANQTITLGGVTRSTWPSTSGANTSLSNLSSVNVNTDLDPDSSYTRDLGSSFRRWDRLYVDIVDLDGGGYIDECRAIYMEQGRTTNPAISGEIRYYDGASKGYRGYVNGFLGQFDLSAV